MNHIYTLTNEQLTRHTNQAIGVLLGFYEIKGLLPTEKLLELNHYRIVVVEKGFFGKFWDTLFGSDESARIIVVRIEND